MEKKNEAKKVRFNIANAMSSVCEGTKESRLKPEETNEYKRALERLSKLYGLSTTQVWIVCYACDRCLEMNDTTGINNLASHMDVQVMKLVGWRKEINQLVEKGMLEFDDNNRYFKPTNAFLDTLYENSSFVPEEKQELDDSDFLREIGTRYENRRDDELSSFGIQRVLFKLEEKHKDLPVVKRVREAIEYYPDRFFLYDVAYDVIRGGESSLNRTISDLWDGNKRFQMATEMMEETHDLFKRGLLEFCRKGNLSDSVFTLSSKGKKLLLGDRAILFEEGINEKNLIKVEDIKEKQLFYSEENQREIDKLKSALQEDTLRSIQKRLEAEGLPIGVAVCAYGAPGTGKTETVKQLGKATGRAIVHVDIADSKSAWFGESEKKIKKIFTNYNNLCESCEKKGEKMPILLFNEADALISKRKTDTSGNCAQTENAIQNIILEELENLKGIFIATTNLAGNMDSAFERRFLFKIKFDKPSVEAKTSIWKNKLSWMDDDSAKEFASQYDFSGGQIDNIVRKVAMNEIITGERPSSEELHAMCKSENFGNQVSGRKIGF
ncbi:MAG: ATP-binding protein [Spirochaetales bacterium]|nr:ATP-binding protein [Spirochaetales bacterium]